MRSRSDPRIWTTCAMETSNRAVVRPGTGRTLVQVTTLGGHPVSIARCAGGAGRHPWAARPRALASPRVSVLSHARAGAQRYRALLALPGARAPVVLSAAGSMPIGMFGLGILLLARDATGSFAEAGRVVGAFSVANALGAVAQGRLMDRLGQTRVLRAAAAGHVPALTALVIAANSGAPTWVLALCALCGGATFPQVPAAMRSLWSALAQNARQRETAYAMVS